MNTNYTNTNIFVYCIKNILHTYINGISEEIFHYEWSECDRK